RMLHVAYALVLSDYVLGIHIIFHFREFDLDQNSFHKESQEQRRKNGEYFTTCIYFREEPSSLQHLLHPLCELEFYHKSNVLLLILLTKLSGLSFCCWYVVMRKTQDKSGNHLCSFIDLMMKGFDER
ncbi:hypothetical protein ACJX0J_021186, partial [Zea mays]